MSSSSVKTWTWTWIAAMAAFFLASASPTALAVSVRLQWNRNSESNNVGYVVYYGTASRTYTSRTVYGDVTSTTIMGLAEGTRYYFAVTSLNDTGNESSYSDEVIYTIGGDNTPPTTLPTFSSMPDINMDEDAISGPNEFFLLGGSPGLTNLILSARSENATLFPNDSTHVNVEHEGTNYYITLVPAEDTSGSSRIHLMVSDGVRTNSTNFLVTVRSINDAPSISSIPILSANQYSEFDPYTFTLGDADSDARDLVVTATSLNPDVLSDQDIILGGSGILRTIDFNTLNAHGGIATIRLNVTDGKTNSTREITVRVNQSNHPPTVNAGTNAVVLMNANYFLRGQVSDDGMPTNVNRVTVEWSLVSGPGNVTFGTPNYIMTSVRFSAAGFYRLRLSAFDGELTNTSDVYVMVRLNTDVTGPVISNLAVADVTASTVTLTWTTDEVADRQVEYIPEGGVSRNTFMNVNRQVTHSVTVTNLSPGTTYTLKARSRDSSGNRTVSDPVVVTTLREVGLYLSSLVAQADVIPPMDVLQTVDGDTYAEVSTPSEGSVNFSLHIPVRDTYYVWARIKSPSPASDTLTCSLDGENTDVFDLANGTWSTEWQWNLLNGRNGGDPFTLYPRTFSLDAGVHTLSFSGLETGVAIQRILVTNDPDYVPNDTDHISGHSSPLRAGESVMQMSIRNGWSMISNPLNSLNTTVQELFPSPISGTAFYKYDPTTGAFEPNTFTAGAWSHPDMTLAVGEGGLLFNPGETFVWSLHGTVIVDAKPLEVTPGGTTLITLTTPVGGPLNRVLQFPFQAGDQVQRLNGTDGTYITNTFNGTDWDVVPVLNVGESIFLRLAAR